MQKLEIDHDAVLARIAKDGTQDAFDGMVPQAAVFLAVETPKTARKPKATAGDPEIAEEAVAFTAALASANVHQLQAGSAT